MTDQEHIDLLRDALDHIARTARASRQSTRRTRWIEQRARTAWRGKPYDEAAFDLPRINPESVERIQKDGRRYRKLRARDLLDTDFAIADLTNLYGDEMDAAVDALPPIPDEAPKVREHEESAA